MSVLKDIGIQYFGLNEFIPQQIYGLHTEARLLHFIDLRVIRAWDWIRSQRGKPIYVNTWGVNRPQGYPIFNGRGLRVGDGFTTSQHFYGRAGDGDEPGTPASELWDWIMQRENQEKLLQIGVTTIEHKDDTPRHVHIDCRNWGTNHTAIVIVRP